MAENENPVFQDAEKTKRPEDWLPVTSSRNAKWYYSAFHNITAMVGAGVLGLPSAMIYLEWGWGTVVLVLSWGITLFTLWQMVEMHEMVPGKRFDRYHELAQHALGPKLGLWILVPQQLVVEVGIGIVYMVTGGSSLRRFYTLVCDDCTKLSLTEWIIVFGVIQVFLSQLPNFNSISFISFAAAVMSVGYSTIAFGTCLNTNKAENVSYHLPSENSTADNIFGVFNALGTVAFAYAGHNVVLEIQATIPSTEEKPSKKPMWRGVILAYILVAYCYFGVAFAGYWAFGNSVGSNVLLTVGKPKWIVATGNFMVFIHVLGSYQIYSMPVFDMIEYVLIMKIKLTPGALLRIVERTLYVAFTCFVGCTIPFFGALLGFFGGFAFAPTTYFMPCILWLRIHKPKMFSLSWTVNWVCIVLGFLLMIVSCIGGLRQIIIEASTYKFYQ